MPEFDIAKVRSLIGARDFEPMKGQVESDWLECKGQPYQIQTEHGKRELAKDVSSLANRTGGLVLIGMRTVKSTVHFGDEIAEVRAVDQSLIDSSQYRSVIREWIFPEPDGITMVWHQVVNSAKGVFVIEVPPQPDEKKPFLICRTVDDKKN